MNAKIDSLDCWIHAVDRFCEKFAGLSVYDLPDCCFADWYEDGMRPATAARKAIRMAEGEEE